MSEGGKDIPKHYIEKTEKNIWFKHHAHVLCLIRGYLEWSFSRKYR